MGFSTNNLGHGPLGVFQKALKIMDDRKTQAGQEETILPLTAGQIQNRAFSAESDSGFFIQDCLLRV